MSRYWVRRKIPRSNRPEKKKTSFLPVVYLLCPWVCCEKSKCRTTVPWYLWYIRSIYHTPGLPVGLLLAGFCCFFFLMASRERLVGYGGAHHGILVDRHSRQYNNTRGPIMNQLQQQYVNYSSIRCLLCRVPVQTTGRFSIPRIFFPQHTTRCCIPWYAVLPMDLIERQIHATTA